MSEMLHQYPVINEREIHVRAWNPEGGETVFCWHGLARNSIDFIELGNALASKGYRVIAPDTLGRGLSQWAEEPKVEYSYANYVTMALKLMDFYCCDKVHWVGTSMGGLMGMLIAASDENADKIATLVLNDIGPEVPADALERIVSYVQTPVSFKRYNEISQYLQSLYQPFGPHTCQQWHTMISASVRRLGNGDYTTHYDPDILAQYDPDTPPINLWRQFDRLDIPLMLMHGLHSDVLTKGIVKKMREMQPDMAVNYYLGCGHAPNLFYPSYRHDVEQFIEQHPLAPLSSPTKYGLICREPMS
ncbi:alpha/beta hydrolase [Grimontia hollisae]|uniref:Putative hydrolase n=1 Tax=Grimontia hollisae CIP 101886 TaxID=675812 RepID=D0I9R0_GRIHO|nr:alpha/beta hydrolase [Grimontia hollisae]AMG29003.1 alpha/beta hydrolase [Grimontia hollisae]EEY71775.1 putative hydrolase [Grimontia hollisae CIP 101886]MDF2184815.1 alpha/beta hydrolase [Grimontia hollisae]STO77087.1 Proline iminopeptidase [Grimontia hollisae]